MFIDYRHAYGLISQEYMLAVLEEMGFPPQFLRLIKMTFVGQFGRAIVNMNLTPLFHMDNGGKQGDPLFPLLYVLAMEGFVALSKSNTHDYEGVSPPSGYLVKHLGYADDTIVTIGSQEDVGELEGLLGVFERASGNEIKPAKSFIMWLGGWSQPRQRVYGIKPISKKASERYLEEAPIGIHENPVMFRGFA